MINFLKHFYFFSKLTTSFILLFVTFFLGYLFVQLYRSNDKLTPDFEQQFDDFSRIIEENTSSIVKLNNKILSNKNNFEKFSNNLEIKKDDSLSEKYFIELNKLNKENKLLLNKIENLNKEIQKIKNSQNAKDSFNRSDYENNQIKENLIDLIRLKFENGSNVKNEILKLKDLDKKINKDYFEKLVQLSEVDFIGLQLLTVNFENRMKEYLNEHYIKQNNNLIFRYISNFITIEPTNKNNFNNKIMGNFAKIKTKLQDKKINSALMDLSTIENRDKFFQGWEKQANYYVNFIKYLNAINQS